ncbi:hypothetical protein SeMB42_g03443 [Synchytrium endobioticum]|uniref:Uncharacterized protein n=1 Tax=Synchytrium endobioticum TaxID=286115 RepID=A0A507D727_9FUNG|nr:hypothetical protein SeMB42_g03443 [Synchytrium endobioticum]
MVAFKDIHSSYAHSRGHTVLAYTPENIITGGSDGFIHVFTTAANDGRPLDKSPTLIQRHTQAVTCISVEGDVIASASEDKTSCSFSLRSGGYEKTITQCHEPVRCVTLAKDGKKCAVASDSTTIRLVNMEDTLDVAPMEGHVSLVRSLAIDPKGHYLASAGINGHVHVWDIRPEEPKCLEILKDISSPGEFVKGFFCTPSWHPNGSVFAIPGIDGDIEIIERDTWKRIFTLQKGHHTGVTCLAWSPNGSYILSTSVDYQIIIWNVDSRVAIVTETHEAPITGLAWHPTINALAFTDVRGELNFWEEPVPTKYPHPARPTHRGVAKPARTANGPSKAANSGSKPVEDAVKTARSDTAKSNKPASHPDSLEDLGAEDLGDDDFVIDDDGAGYVHDISTREGMRKYHMHAEKQLGERMGLHRYQYPLIDATSNPGIEPQEAFQPGATPIKGGRKYLAFNTRGVIYSVEQTVHSTVYVEFHDKGQRSFHFQDYSNYTLGCLGDRGALFAAETQNSLPSKIEYRSFDSWGTKQDWMFLCSPLENVKALALTDHGAAVATDSNYLRFVSNSGIQTAVKCLDGPIVSMSGFRDFLFVVYHAGVLLNKDQRLAYQVYDLSLNRRIADKLLLLSPAAELEWIGFSEAGLPATYDSVGILRMLDISDDLDWIPFLDTRISKSLTKTDESYWPIGVTDTNLLCVILKGAERHPHFPKPLIHEIPLQIPLLSLDLQSGQLEERYLRASLLAKHHRNEAERKVELATSENELQKVRLEMDKILLQLIQAACAAERMSRALDLCTMLHLPKSVEGALKLAVHHHMPALAERMNLVKEAKMIKQQEEEDELYNRQSPRSMKLDVLSLETESNKKHDWIPPSKVKQQQQSNSHSHGERAGLRSDKVKRNMTVVADDHDIRDTDVDQGERSRAQSNCEASCELAGRPVAENVVEKTIHRNPFAVSQAPPDNGTRITKSNLKVKNAPPPVAGALFAAINEVAANGQICKDETTTASKKRKGVIGKSGFGGKEGDDDTNEKKRKKISVPTKNASITAFLNADAGKPKINNVEFIPKPADEEQAPPPSPPLALSQ